MRCTEGPAPLQLLKDACDLKSHIQGLQSVVALRLCRGSADALAMRPISAARTREAAECGRFWQCPDSMRPWYVALQ